MVYHFIISSRNNVCLHPEFSRFIVVSTGVLLQLPIFHNGSLPVKNAVVIAKGLQSRVLMDQFTD